MLSQWTHPTQLELPLSQRDNCTGEGSIPGLDAELCRCPGCQGRAKDGVWWFDGAMRQRVMKRQIAYNFTVSNGDTLRDAEAN